MTASARSQTPPTPDTAVILAAGRGARLSPLTDKIPKCLLPIGRSTLIQLQVKHLRRAGIRRIVIVTGYHEEKVRKACGTAPIYILNRRYKSTNSLYSLWRARAHVRRGCLVLNSDVVFHPTLLRFLLESPHPDALLIDLRDTLGEEEMKAVVRDGWVRHLSKDIAPADAHGENLGLIKLSPEGGRRLMGVAHDAFSRGEYNLWVPQGIDRMLGSHPFRAIPTQGLPWTEIDYLHDLHHARKTIYPLCRS